MNVFTKLSLAACACASVSAFANGTGYNGPDLQPVSIPIQLDRGISVGDLGDAIRVCLVEGDTARGLVSVVARAEAQVAPNARILPYQYPNATRFEASAQYHVIAGSVSYVFDFAGTRTSDAANLSSNWSGGRDVLVFGVATKFDDTIQVRTEPGLFPFLSFQEIIQDGGYDELGRHLDAKTIVRGLSILVPPNFEQIGAALPTVNSTTGARTSVTLNGKEYVQCLVSRIQR